MWALIATLTVGKALLALHAGPEAAGTLPRAA
jgi:hypothetical protein